MTEGISQEMFTAGEDHKSISQRLLHNVGLRARTHTHTHTQTHTHTNTHTHTHAHIALSVKACLHTKTQTHSLKMHAAPHTHMASVPSSGACQFGPGST